MNLEERARKVKILLSDVDGVLTDSKIIYDTHGGELKCFNVQDGVGLFLMASQGIKVILISARGSSILRRRAREIKVSKLYQNVKDKSKVFQRLLRKFKISPDEVCYMGDDLPDLSAMRQAGFAVAVPNAAPEVRDAAHYITKKEGGAGAAREIAELILKAQGKWEDAVKRYR